MTLLIVKFGANRIFAISLLAAIDTTARQERSKFGDGNPEKLLTENMVDALRQIWHFIFQTHYQPFGYLPQENTRFAGWVEKTRLAVVPN